MKIDGKVVRLFDKEHVYTLNLVTGTLTIAGDRVTIKGTLSTETQLPWPMERADLEIDGLLLIEDCVLSVLTCVGNKITIVADIGGAHDPITK